MKSKDDYIKKLILLHKEKTGVALSEDKAMDLFENLITLVGSIYKPINSK